MNKLELLGIDQDIYFEKLNNGLEVYILPFKHKNNYFINYFTKFGSTTLEFFSKEENKMIKVPEGIARLSSLLKVVLVVMHQLVIKQLDIIVLVLKT